MPRSAPAGAGPNRRTPALPGLAIVAACALAAAASCAGGGGEQPSPGNRAAGSPDAPPVGSGKPVTLVFAGDTAVRGVSEDLQADDPASVFGPAAELLRDADLALLNLETAVTNGGGAPLDKAFTFATGPEVFDSLRAAGVDGVTMANNHGVDYGPAGLAETLDIIDEDGFPVMGIGRDESAAYAPAMYRVNGQRIGVIGATEVIDSQLVDSWTATDVQPGLASAKRVDRLIEAVRAARRQADTVVVFIHWGEQYVPCPTDTQVELAPRLVEAGADIVVGGHQHRVAAAGFLGDGLVSYGLGNFLFPPSTPAAGHSGVLEVTVTGRRIDDYRWRPAVINDLNQPVPATDKAAAGLMKEWEALRSCTNLAAERG
ncbi:MAG: CapA family protein [Microthrixaceae bacterium]